MHYFTNASGVWKYYFRSSSNVDRHNLTIEDLILTVVVNLS